LVKPTPAPIVRPLPSLRALAKTRELRGGFEPLLSGDLGDLQLAVFNVARRLRETAIAYL
jgi:hypothetical protein